MSRSRSVTAEATGESVAEEPSSQKRDTATGAQRSSEDRKEARRWWIRLFVQPALLLASGALLIAGLGIAQRYGLISGGGAQAHAPAGGEAVRYICPMMCTPPQSEPGRCPVCAMELVPATTANGASDSRSIQIDAATRRVANIRTVAVRAMPMARTIRAIGELNYDEGTLKTISAYVDGRIDRLYADYTGVAVATGDHLALVYSPRLYSGQVELLLAKKARDASRSATLTRVLASNRDLYDSAKQRLVEMGMTPLQIEQLEQSGEADSRLHLCAPSSGTVIEKLAVEGQYVKEGQAIYRLADLSTVWLMLKMFPEDAATIRYGQRVEATVQSLPGRTFTGRVAFIDPNVDPKTRTVGVRVVIPNENGLLRVGDYAKATVEVPISGPADQHGAIYDAELANKWISPRHPHVVESAPGKCRLCGVDLVPATRFGFSTDESDEVEALVVPRDAVLMAGRNSVLYVESKPGRFELRRVVLGPGSADQIVILSGVEEGEHVATRGNFLIDSQMQLAGNPSLIDPTKSEASVDESESSEMIAALDALPTEDRGLAETQRICPVTMMPLGSMGTPPKVDVNGKMIFICCEGCRGSLLDNPEKYLAKIVAAEASEESHTGTPPMELPPIGVPQIVQPQGVLPPIGMPRVVTASAIENRPEPGNSTDRIGEKVREKIR